MVHDSVEVTVTAAIRIWYKAVTHDPVSLHGPFLPWFRTTAKPVYCAFLLEMLLWLAKAWADWRKKNNSIIHFSDWQNEHLLSQIRFHGFTSPFHSILFTCLMFPLFFSSSLCQVLKKSGAKVGYFSVQHWLQWALFFLWDFPGVAGIINNTFFLLLDTICLLSKSNTQLLLWIWAELSARLCFLLNRRWAWLSLGTDFELTTITCVPH